jgi:serine/threonine-protein kinase
MANDPTRSGASLLDTEETWFPDGLPDGPAVTIRQDALDRRGEAGSEAERAREALSATRPPYAFGATLGQGGMGLVRAAVQNRLAREVAVKSLRPEARPEVAQALLHEAWITGALEHPNIVPIYDVALDDNGLPQVVLKRIEGTSWTELLDDPTALPDDADDVIAFHLEVLVAVCRAVEFAHSRGILHRDLKPDNVMIGPFGEVYVLDWGIAVSLENDAGGRFPLARDQQLPSGTPLYMAPEMIGDGSRLRPETDVFLLAGLLYRVLAGHPPRMGESLAEILVEVERPIALHPDWPEDLQELLRAAFSLAPGARPTAAAFREAVQRHLRRRAVLHLYERVLVDVDALMDLLRADAHDRIEVYDRFGAIRFGLREVLDRWPEHVAARETKAQVLQAMIALEIEARDPRAARILLRDLDGGREALEARIADLERALDTERLALERLAADADDTAGARSRVAILAGLAVVWMGGPTILPLFGIPPGYPRGLGVAIGQFVATAAVFALTYRTVFRTRANRTMMSLLVIEPLMTILSLWAAKSWGLDIDRATVLELLIATTLIALGTLLIDRRVIVSALVFFGIFLFCIPNPEWVRTLSVPAIVVLVANVLVVWGWPEKETP